MTGDIKLQMNEYLPLRDVVFQTLRQAILSGQLEPEERLMEIHLASLLGVSRTPVREALRMLEKEGLVVTMPRRGAVVARITRKDLEDVLEVRCALEELAAVKACHTMGEKELKKLREAAVYFEQCSQQDDLTKSAQADAAFHEIISEATDNNRLTQLLNNLQGQIYRYRLENLKDRSVYPNLLRQHDEIIAALEEHSEEKAIEAVNRHIEGQRKSILGSLKLEQNV